MVAHTDNSLPKKNDYISEKKQKFSYRPNHVHGRRRSGWAADVTAEGGLLCPCSPGILLPSLNVVVLNQVRTWSLIVIKQWNPKKKKKKLRKSQRKFQEIKKNLKRKQLKQNSFPGSSTILRQVIRKKKPPEKDIFITETIPRTWNATKIIIHIRRKTLKDLWN